MNALVTKPYRRALSGYLRSAGGRDASPLVRKRIADALAATELGDIVTTAEQVHVLREMFDELERLRPTPAQPAARARKR